MLYGQQDVGSDYGSRGILSDAEVASMLGSLPREESRLVFGASADVSLWHRRLAHKVNAQHLRRIWKENLVDGLSLKGNLNKLTTCGCMTCRMVKARKRASSSENKRQPPTKIGERVSTDIKNVTTASVGGFRYCVVFVDCYSVQILCRVLEEAH